MLSVAKTKNIIPGFEKSPSFDLRQIRNRFYKHYIKGGEQLNSSDSLALLLYWSLAFLETSIGTDKTFQLKNTVQEANAEELAEAGQKLLDLLNEFLPCDLQTSGVTPRVVSWQKAKEFFSDFSKPIHSNFYSQITNLGFFYQILSSAERVKQALPAVQKANKTISKRDLISFTQLYTPDWVVEFLLANSILPDFSFPNISTRYSCWLLEEKSASTKTVDDLKKLSLIDPACGAGNFLFLAFDLLMELYEQYGCKKQEAAELIFRNNIYGADIDENALWTCALGLLCLYIKSLGHSTVKPDIFNNLAWIRTSDANKPCTESNFLGSIDKRLVPEHFLCNKKYSVLVTNPPYIGRRCLSRHLKSALREQYPMSSADLAAAFLERSLKMLEKDAYLGIITQSSFMSIPSYKILRDFMLKDFHLKRMVYCGTGVFPLNTGEKIDNVLLVLKPEKSKDINTKTEPVNRSTHFIDLGSVRNKGDILKKNIEDFVRNQKDITTPCRIKVIDQKQLERGIPTGTLSQLSSAFYSKIERMSKLADIADIRQGLATTNNGKFVRFYFDVDNNMTEKVWVPYIKGAGAERYVSNNPYVVKWGKNGREIKDAVARAYPYLEGKTNWVVKNEEFYFRPGLCFSFINKSGLAVRRLPAGAIFDVASSAIFTTLEYEDFLLAYLNSRIIGLLVKEINSTINIQVGDLKKIPIISVKTPFRDELACLGNSAFALKKRLIEFPLCNLENGKIISIEYLLECLSFYRNETQRLEKELIEIQNSVDNRIIKEMQEQELLTPKDQDILSQALAGKEIETKQQTEIGFAFKLFNKMISRAVYSVPHEKIILLSLESNEAAASLFNMSTDAVEWLENYMGMTFTTYPARKRVIDLGKYAQEPSRYFIYFFPDQNYCMFFSSSAARGLKHSTMEKNYFFGQKNSPIEKEKICQAADKIWSEVFKKLDDINDWTSRDLFTAFRSID